MDSFLNRPDDKYHDSYLFYATEFLELSPSEDPYL